jgi:hypothetical protein
MGEKDNERTNMSDDQEYLLYNLSSRKTLVPNQGWYKTNNQYAMPTAASDPKPFDIAIGHMQAIRMLSVIPSEYGLEYGYSSLDN